ncbi:MAG: hypothetical protein ABI585_12495 [Betaproteobacteria bacterium]
MSGSEESDDDLVTGRVNRSNDQTTLWAENHYESTGIGPIETGSLRVEFNGPAILVVEVAKDTEEDGEFRPSSPIDAIVGIGWSADWAGQSGGVGVIGVGGEVGGTGVLAKGGEGGIGLHADAGGDATGVFALAGPRAGTGVFGLGGGGERLLRRGAGGKGVHGVGGIASLRTAVLPGIGVFGQGGQIHEGNPDRTLLGTGVIGVGGDAGNKDMPPVSDAGSVGVYGQGADAIVTAIVDGATTTFDGPAEPGAGVVGRGGVQTGARPNVAAGVIGVAGGHAKPTIAETGSIGVAGHGPTGVSGVGVGGPGVRGTSDSNRGGIFSSRAAPQVQLLPFRVRTVLPDPTPVNPTAISLGLLKEGVASLPKTGQAGDLMTLLDDTRMCTLWFCVKGWDKVDPAQWTQVLLGPSFPGQS